MYFYETTSGSRYVHFLYFEFAKVVSTAICLVVFSFSSEAIHASNQTTNLCFPFSLIRICAFRAAPAQEC